MIIITQRLLLAPRGEEDVLLLNLELRFVFLTEGFPISSNISQFLLLLLSHSSCLIFFFLPFFSRVLYIDDGNQSTAAIMPSTSYSCFVDFRVSPEIRKDFYPVIGRFMAVPSSRRDFFLFFVSCCQQSCVFISRMLHNC